MKFIQSSAGGCKLIQHRVNVDHDERFFPAGLVSNRPIRTLLANLRIIGAGDFYEDAVTVWTVVLYEEINGWSFCKNLYCNVYS